MVSGVQPATPLYEVGRAGCLIALKESVHIPSPSLTYMTVPHWAGS